MSGSIARRPLAVAPVPDIGVDIVACETRDLLRRFHASLIADKGIVAWSRISSVERDEPPLVRLSFAGPLIVINAAWCRYFRAQIHPTRGGAWLARAAFYDPNASEVYLKPCQNPIDIEAAFLWNLDADDNPLVTAKIGFNYIHPMRTIAFPRIPASRLH
ncbi:MAG TPA: hypothetical protein VN397_02855 [Candidatus Methylomirabilis sp.]|nr:hypothetical protein [Candidatus Methylomirabilis sp.]